MSHHNADGLIEVAGIHTSKVEVGSKIRFVEGRRMKNRKYYTVQASNRFYSICNQPLNMIRRIGGGKYKHEKTCLYTIIDWVHRIRGTENLVFGRGAETKEQCEEMLERLTNGESDISQRNWCKLEIEKAILI